MTARSKKITGSANSQQCTVRLISICNGNPETVMFTHIGKQLCIGIKCADYFGVYACFSCHDEIDRRPRIMQLNDLKADLLSALEDTLERLFDVDLMTVK